MWPWAHAAFGYLCYSLYLCLSSRSHPTGEAAIVLGIGTQLPDLIDKPFAWYVDVLPYGRSFAHSLLTGVPLVLAPLVVLALWRGRRDLAAALAVGYLTHLVGDGLHAVVSGRFTGLNYLLWPLLPIPPSETVGLLTHLRQIEGSPAFLYGLLLTVGTLALWAHHGFPGLRTLWDWTLGRVRRG